MFDTVKQVTQIITTIIGFIALVFGIFKSSITFLFKSEIERLLTPRQKQVWEGFLESAVTSLIVSLALISLGYLLEKSLVSPIYFASLKILMLISVHIIILVIIFLFKIFNFSINANTLAINLIKICFTLIMLNVLTLNILLFHNGQLRLAVSKESVNYFLIYSLLLTACFTVVLITIKYSLSTFAHNKHQAFQYKIQVIEEEFIKDELSNLYLAFTLNSDIQILTIKRGLKDNTLPWPIYVFYFKENILHKYIRIKIK
ncbi:hypothetical protein [Priestia megaterium]|uniref:hypothetical protein n=1 Tax=Priestia megaterium TaxID=1404 RepID=UPI001D28B527|nr:hypothetical protein [Priestia megaterium]CAH0303018.1 hypothetical protein SRABI82_04621 [Priestia megaterium]